MRPLASPSSQFFRSTILLSLSLGDNAGSLVNHPGGYPVYRLPLHTHQSPLPVTLSITATVYHLALHTHQFPPSHTEHHSHSVTFPWSVEVDIV